LVGQWLIALGEKVFGMNPLGWRIAPAIVGTLMVLVMVRLARRLTGSMLLGIVAGLLLSFDGLQLVLSRLALLDIFVAFFVLAGVHCMVADRDWHRAKMARLVPRPPVGSWGPIRKLLFRPWLLLGGVCWGLAAASKWEAVYPLAAFGILVWMWSAGARRSFGFRWSVLKSALVDGLPAFVHLVLVGFIVYVATWTGWLIHADQFEQHLSSTQYTQYTGQGHCQGTDYISDNPNPNAHWPTAGKSDSTGLDRAIRSLRSLWSYHKDVYTFHTHFLNCADHPYRSNPMSWLILKRPVGVTYDGDIKPGQDGCDASAGDTCVRQVLLLGSPAVWWIGCFALIYGAMTWIGSRDWRFGVPVIGALATWLPWLQYAARPIFSFYAVVTLPFLVLAITLGIGNMINSPTTGRRRTIGLTVAGAYMVLVLINFIWMWPIWTGQVITHGQWMSRMWFKNWI
jgi:dolichyl-phosphate-mannose--protein O-mannosyl transferase